MMVVICFAMSSMFSYSYYGSSCATYLLGQNVHGGMCMPLFCHWLYSQ